MNQYVRPFLALLASYPAEAAEIAWWWMCGKRVRAVGRLRSYATKLPENFTHWLVFHQPEQLSPSAIEALREETKRHKPVAIHLHIQSDEDLPAARSTISSVVGQHSDGWEMFISGDTRAQSDLPSDPRIHFLEGPFQSRRDGLVAAAGRTSASHIIPLQPDFTMTPGAVFAFGSAIWKARAAAPAIIYADQDERDQEGKRSNPWLKPEWDPELFLSQDYLSAACAIPVEQVLKARFDTPSNEDAVFALLLDLVTGANAAEPRHLAYIVVTTPSGNWCRSSKYRLDLLHHAVGRDMGAKIEAGPFGTANFRHALPQPAPKLSVIVPTRDRLELLQPCVEGVLHNTDYPNLELVIADNGSVEDETLEYLDKCARNPRVKIVRWPHPYNYSAINNFAVKHSSGAYLCLLNNDIEIIDPGWLREMMVHAVRPGVGAVGARLLYPDQTIQHAGVVVGMGNAAGHAHRGLQNDMPGYFAQSLVARTATAVTAACLIVSRENFDAVSGLDETGLAVAYNDVDLCLKLRERGLRNIYVPQAVLIHHESKSRGLDFAPENLARYMRELETFQQRWKTIGYCDPTHHEALDPASETYRIKL